MDAKTKRCRRNTERQTQARTPYNATDGFLKCMFLPKLKTTQACKDYGETEKMEKDLYQSLAQLARHYHIAPMQHKAFGFPYNIALAKWEVETQLKRTRSHWDGLRLVQDSGKTFFVSKERYDTGTTLFYIPVTPLFQMLKDPKRKKTAQLLVSVCSYLYHIAKIPYYRQESTYLYWQYEMLEEWLENDDHTDQTESCKHELRQAESIGDQIGRKLYNRTNLQVFRKRLNRFKPRDTFDAEYYRIACDAFALYSAYPNTTIFRNTPLPEQDPYTDEYSHETIGMEKYISFVADTKGWLYDTLVDCVNNEFNEYGEVEEPTLYKQFDEGTITADTFDFEARLFALLSDLGRVLYNYKTTTT